MIKSVRRKTILVCSLLVLALHGHAVEANFQMDTTRPHPDRQPVTELLPRSKGSDRRHLERLTQNQQGKADYEASECVASLAHRDRSNTCKDSDTSRNGLEKRAPSKEANQYIAATGMLIWTPASEPPQSPLLSTDEWDSRFRKVMVKEHEKNLKLAQSANSFKHYSLAYAIDGLAAQYEATDDTEYLDLAVLYIGEVMASAMTSSRIAKSQYKDDYKGWGAREHPDPTIDGDEYPLFESFLWRYVARLLRVMNESGIADEHQQFQASYDQILTFLEVNIFDKWYKRGLNNIYRSRTHMASHWAYISLELVHLTKDKSRRKKANLIVHNINEMLRAQMIRHPKVAGGYFWNSVCDSSSPPGQDVAHGNAVVAYIVEAVELDEGWSMNDIRALSRTLQEAVWRVDNGYANFAEFVDGSGEGTGWFSDGFIKLGRFDRAIQAKLDNHNIGRTTQFYGNGTLNAKRLSHAYEKDM